MKHHRIVQITAAFVIALLTAGTPLAGLGQTPTAEPTAAEVTAIETAGRIDGLGGQSPQFGDTCIRAISPEILEIARTTGKAKGASQEDWNFVVDGSYTAPAADSLRVWINNEEVAATITGFRRRVAYAPIVEHDIRIDNRIFVTISPATPLQDGDAITAATTGWEAAEAGAEPNVTELAGVFRTSRRNPAIHVNQVGYQTIGAKQAMAGYYLGSGGELEIPAAEFRIVDTTTEKVVFTGKLVARPDSGFACTPLPYQKVMMADFSELEVSGNYQLEIEGLGRSLAFDIDPDMTLGFARTYAQGLYNQRCGSAVELPHGRHTHAACHVAPAGIPTADEEFDDTWFYISEANSGTTDATRMVSVETQLYPIQRSGSIDLCGGHHDAGDYSKYTINSAQLIHHLIFAADNFPGAGALDNLGIPESGDGKSDLLQEANIEASFLAKMQDTDGGFFFLVYPKHRKYENDVLPDEADEQVVWPKNTASTAAAVGALADIGSSPLFQQQFPAEAATYLAKAQAGWNFLLAAIEAHGKDGSYQKITHYGDIFTHNDELAWAAASMFAATGNAECQQKFIEWYDPEDTETIRWGWWHLFEGYGCAARSYTFAVSAGKRTAEEMAAAQWAKTGAIIKAAGDAVATRSAANAYGTCLDSASKRWMTAGWFFSGDWAFDITTHNALETRDDWQELVLGNMNFELGCNPNNVSFITGAGQRQQHEIVHQYAQNDNREFPPSGLPLGNLQAGFPWTSLYTSELGSMNYPFDHSSTHQYPLYDRWGDTYNTATEFVIAQQARQLAGMAALAAGTPGASEPWQTVTAQIACEVPGMVLQNSETEFQLVAGDLDLSRARVIWETPDDYQICGAIFHHTPALTGSKWIEAEAVLPDGRRFTARKNFGVRAVDGAAPFEVEADTVALYHMDANFDDATANGFNLTVSGTVERDALATGWMSSPSGSAARFYRIGDMLTVSIPDSRVSPTSSATALTLEMWIHPLDYRSYGKSLDPLCNLYQSWDRQFGIQQDMWINPNNPFIKVDGVSLLDNTAWSEKIVTGTWQLVSISRDSSGNYTLKLNNEMVATASNPGYTGYSGTGDWKFTLGNFDGFLDEVRITGSSASETGSGPDESTDGSSESSDSDSDGTGSLASPSVASPPARQFTADENTVALYHFDGDFLDSSGNQHDLINSTTLEDGTAGVVLVPAFNSAGVAVGSVARIQGFGHALVASIPDAEIAPGRTSQELTIEAWIYPRAYKAHGSGVAGILWLSQHRDSSLGIQQEKWLAPPAPMFRSGTTTVLSNSDWSAVVKLEKWQKIRMTRNSEGMVWMEVDGKLVASAMVSNAYRRTGDWTLRVGDIDADIDELRISRSSDPAQPASEEFENDEDTIALYHFNSGYEDESGNGHHLQAEGNTSLITNPGWMEVPAGASAQFADVGDKLSVVIPNSEVSPTSGGDSMCIEARVYADAYMAHGKSVVRVLGLYQDWDSALGMIQDKWLKPAVPLIRSGPDTVLTNSTWNSLVTTGAWHQWKLNRWPDNTVTIELDGEVVVNTTTTNENGRTTDWTLELGNFAGEIDELRISRVNR